MKKKSIKSLNLNKKSVSKLNGGREVIGQPTTFQPWCQVNTENICHPDPDLSIGHCPTAATCVGSCACQVSVYDECPSDSTSMLC